jgi:hypothetical protein
VADNGIAIMLTNDRNLWSPSPRVSGNDRAFHINEGVMLTGVLRRATDLYPGDTHELGAAVRSIGTTTPSWRGSTAPSAGRPSEVGGRQKADESSPSAG